LGYVDQKSDAASCQRYCAMAPDCNFWSYHPLRSDKRCHLCSRDLDWSDCTEPGSCVFGPALCPGEEAQDATTILLDAVAVAKTYCDANGGSAAEPSSGAMLIAAENMNTILKNIDSYFASVDELTEAADNAAAVLSDSGCFSSATACDHSAVLLLQIRGLLLLFDGHSDRAFPDGAAERKSLWDAHRVLIADNEWFDDNSLRAIRSFFDDLPPHLLSDGVLFDAPFATMTVRDAFDCGSDSSAGTLLTFTDRGFNVFQNQVGQSTENAFPSDADPVRGDLLLTVLRHEVSHQFDRVVAADGRLSALMAALRGQCDSDDDYLRSQVGHDYFVSAPQEIIASQVGNQYFLDSAAQLRLSIDRFAATTMPLSWMLFIFDLVSESNTVTLYQELSSSTGETATTEGLLTRDANDRIIGLTVSGCAPFSFSYGAQSGVVDSYSGPADCAIDFDAAPFEADEAATGQHGAAGLVIAVVAGICLLCAVMAALCFVGHRRKNAMAGSDGVGEAERDNVVAEETEAVEWDMTPIGMDDADTANVQHQERNTMIEVNVTETAH